MVTAPSHGHSHTYNSVILYFHIHKKQNTVTFHNSSKLHFQCECDNHIKNACIKFVLGKMDMSNKPRVCKPVTPHLSKPLCIDFKPSSPQKLTLMSLLTCDTLLLLQNTKAPIKRKIIDNQIALAPIEFYCTEICATLFLHLLPIVCINSLELSVLSSHIKCFT